MKISYWVFAILCIIGIVYMFLSRTAREPEKIEFIQGGDIEKAHYIDSLEKRILQLEDSLYSEYNPCQIELSRYRIAFQIFVRRNPKAAAQYGSIISEETE